MDPFDPQKMLILYFLVTSTVALNLDVDKQSLINYISNLAVRNDDGFIYGFKPTPMLPTAEPNIIHSYCAIATLKMLGQSDILDDCMLNKRVIMEWIMTLQNEQGSMNGSLTS